MMPTIFDDATVPLAPAVSGGNYDVFSDYWFSVVILAGSNHRERLV